MYNSSSTKRRTIAEVSPSLVIPSKQQILDNLGALAYCDVLLGVNECARRAVPPAITVVS